MSSYYFLLEPQCSGQWGWGAVDNRINKHKNLFSISEFCTGIFPDNSDIYLIIITIISGTFTLCYPILNILHVSSNLITTL